MGGNRAAGLVAELLRDPYSHCSAAASGWSYVPDPTDVMFRNWVDATAMMHHQPGKVRPRPVERPWESGHAPAWRAPDPAKEQRRARLRERLGLNS